MFTRPQLITVIQVLLNGFCSTVDSCFAAKPLDGTAEQLKTWQKDRASTSWDSGNFLCALINMLGDQLACFYATVTEDGISPGDALELNHLGDNLNLWAKDWIAGRVGLQDGRYHRPDVDSLAREWVDAAFDCDEFGDIVGQHLPDFNEFLERIGNGYYDNENGTAQFKRDILDHYGEGHERKLSALFASNRDEFKGRELLEEVLGDFVKMV